MITFFLKLSFEKKNSNIIFVKFLLQIYSDDGF